MSDIKINGSDLVSAQNSIKTEPPALSPPGMSTYQECFANRDVCVISELPRTLFRDAVWGHPPVAGDLVVGKALGLLTYRLSADELVIVANPVSRLLPAGTWGTLKEAQRAACYLHADVLEELEDKDGYIHSAVVLLEEHRQEFFRLWEALSNRRVRQFTIQQAR